MRILGVAVRADGTHVPLVGGLFFLHDTYGLHLIDAILHLRKKLGAEGSLPDFFADALLAGWTEEHATSTVREVVAIFEGPRIADKQVPLLVAYGKQLFMERSHELAALS